MGENKKVERRYYPIDEATARLAHDLMSHYEYCKGLATHSYKTQVEEAYSIVDEIAEKRPDRLDRALQIADTYSKKLAANLNENHRIGTRCPSVLVAGFANFPVHKKEKQVAALDRNMEEWRRIQGYIEELKRILYGKEIIRSDDENALQKLEEKREKLRTLQERMKKVNTYYRKNKSLDGCPELSSEQIEALRGFISVCGVPFPTYELSNNNAEIHRLDARIATLRKEKSQETTETENTESGYTVKENVEDMRLQIFFDDVPSAEVRGLLKHNAFKWSPKNGCWQRQLTDNARYAFKKLSPMLRELLRLHNHNLTRI